MGERLQADDLGDPAPVKSSDWTRGIIVVLLFTIAIVAGGLWILGHTIGGCGAAVPC